MIVRLLVAKFYEFATLRAAIPVFDDGANVTAVDGLPVAPAITALGVFEIVRGVPGDLDVGGPDLVTDSWAESEELTCSGGSGI